jgi:hypothetical protein
VLKDDEEQECSKTQWVSVDHQVIMLLCSDFVVDIWLHILCGIVLKEEGLTLVTH